jgi:hypothetical protein
MGQMDNIIKRFSDTSSGTLLTTTQIHGLYKYMMFLVDKQIVSGPTKQSYSSFGSLIAVAL